MQLARSRKCFNDVEKLQMAVPKSEKKSVNFPCIGHKRHIYFLTGCVHSELTDKTLHKLYSPSKVLQTSSSLHLDRPYLFIETYSIFRVTDVRQKLPCPWWQSFPNTGDRQFTINTYNQHVKHPIVQTQWIMCFNPRLLTFLR